MFTKKLLVSALLAAGMIGGVATPLSSMAAVEIQLNFAPPAPRYEAVPAPRRGYVWSAGHWQWNANRNRRVWAPGAWHSARSGYVYNQPQWVESNGRWKYQASRWDRDGDGIANNRDRTPDGVAVQSRDNDRDGVPNNRDNYPNNPNYR